LGEHADARRMIELLGRQGIHIRAFEHRPAWLRFGLPANDEEFGRLATAFN
jgi:cobalamin biosynthetic protein CobC